MQTTKLFSIYLWYLEVTCKPYIHFQDNVGKRHNMKSLLCGEEPAYKSATVFIRCTPFTGGLCIHDQTETFHRNKHRSFCWGPTCSGVVTVDLSSLHLTLANSLQPCTHIVH